MDLIGAKVRDFGPPKQWAMMETARARQSRTGESIIHFERGDFAGPDFTAPPGAVEAAVRELTGGAVRYDPGAGSLALREAIAEFMLGRGCVCTPDQVVVTTGAKHALHMVLLTVLNPGDEIIVPNPGYPPDYVWAGFAGARIVELPLNRSDWSLDVELLRRLITPRTKALILNTPQRPTGEIIGDLRSIAEVCAQNNVLVISDEIFSQVTYSPNAHESISRFAGDVGLSCVAIDTFSKTYAMTGWRIGWCVAPPELAKKLGIFLQDSVTNVPVFTQQAALAALRTSPQWLADRLALLEQRRDLMIRELSAMPGLSVTNPPATFYAFPDVSGTGLTADDFSLQALEGGVAVVPGSAFGSVGNANVRMTFALPEADLVEGCARLRTTLDRLTEGASLAR